MPPKKKKPDLVTRKPPVVPAVDPVAVAEFVSGRNQSTSPALRPKEEGIPSHRVAPRTDGRTMRRLTVYLPVETHRALASYSADHECDRSDTINKALLQFLQIGGAQEGK